MILDIEMNGKHFEQNKKEKEAEPMDVTENENKKKLRALRWQG